MTRTYSRHFQTRTFCNYRNGPSLRAISAGRARSSTTSLLTPRSCSELCLLDIQSHICLRVPWVQIGAAFGGRSTWSVKNAKLSSCRSSLTLTCLSLLKWKLNLHKASSAKNIRFSHAKRLRFPWKLVKRNCWLR